MSRIELAPEVLDDFERFFQHQALHGIEDTPEQVSQIVDALQLRTHSPLIGLPVRNGKRELVIGQGTRGYVALYRYVAALDTVFVLALRAQRESGYKRPD